MGEVQRQALARDLARRLPCLGLDELRLVDYVVARLQLGRERYGELDLAAPRDWGKELAEELVDALVYQAARELAAQDREREGLREAARQEMVGGPIEASIADLATKVAAIGGKVDRVAIPADRVDVMVALGYDVEIDAGDMGGEG